MNLPKTKRDYIDLYVSLGFTPIPIYAGEKKPSVHWEEWQTKRPSKDKIRSWFDYTDRDVATICGNVSDGLVVIDCDNQATFDLITKNIELVKKTIIVKSPHGWHIYLRTDNVPTPRHYRLDDIKLDILGEGSIVVLPPSTSSAGVYAFDASLSTDDYTILRMDNVIGTVEDALRIVGIDVAKATSLRSDNERLGDEGFRELLANVKEGNRHDVVLRATNYLKQKSSLSLEAIYDYLAPYVLNCPAEHSWTDKELRAEILKAFNYKSNEQRYFEKNNPQPLKMKNPDDIKEAQLGESLIDGVLHRSDVILLYAPSGEGKSIYATNICAALINGTRALELWNTRKCRVGFADYEMPVGELKLRFHEILGNTLGYSNFFTESFQGRRLINEAHIDELEANIKELKLDVLIIDNLSSASGTVKDENTGVQRDVMDTIRGLAKRTNCAIIVIHHTGKPKYDPDGNSVRMTPRGHSSISDASDVELQILKTERENVTSLLCTKSRGVRNTIRKEWRRDFYYDSDSFTITPLNEEDSTKTTTVARLKSAKEALKIGDRELGDLLSVNFSTVARWLRGENLPSETRLSKIREIIENLENRLGKSVSSENATLAQRLEGNERAPYINKKNDVSQTETKTSSVKHNSAKAKKTTIDLNNPCASCPACKEKTTRFVDGEGTCSNGIMFIAQCPGEVEMTTTPRRPLIGPAGQEFNRLLKVAYIKREECRITNLVKCGHIKPPDPLKKEVDCCSILLQREIEKYKPKLIIPLGSYAWSFFGFNTTISSSHGKLFKRETFNRPYDLLPMYHPSAVLHNPGLKKILNHDFDDLHFKTSAIVTLPRGKYEKALSFDSRDTTAFDFETESLDSYSSVLGTSYSDRDGQAVYVVGEPKEILIKRAIAHNAKFELKRLKTRGIKYNFDRLDDSYLLAKVLCLEHGGLKELALSELGVIMTRFEDIAVNNSLVEANLDEVVKYACADSDMTRQLFNKLELVAKRDFPKLWKLYDEIERLVTPVIVDMELIGLRIDVDYLNEVGKELDKELKEIAKKAERDFELTETIINSPKQLGEYLKAHNVPIWKKTSTGQLSTEADVLEALAHDYPFIQAVLEYRKPAKLKSTYVDGWLKLIDSNNYVYPEYTQIINSGRLSSNEPNAQNLPVGDKIRRAIIAPEGKKLAAFDYSQAHIVIVAYLAEDDEILESFRNGIDFHTQTANDLGVKAVGDMPARQIAKHLNYAMIKGASAQRLATDAGVSKEEAEEFIALWYKRHPKVKRYLDETTAFAKAHGYTDSFYGRRRYSDKVFASDFRTINEGVRELVDMPMQGTEADIMKKAMIACYGLAPICMQVHDELVFIVNQKDKALLDEIKRRMTSVTDIPIQVECKVADNFGDV